MKHILTLLLAGTCLLAACNNNASDKPVIDSAATETGGKQVPERPEAVCYAGHSGKDSVFLMAYIDGNVISGNLKYDFFEKDKNNGKFDGTISGDTILVDYTFASEGTNSIRQVAFLKKGDQLIEGYGDMAEKNGKMSFRNTGALRFSNGFVLDKSECGEWNK